MATLYPSFTSIYHHEPYPAIDPLQFDCSDKTVLITGAGTGIGQAIAVAFAEAQAKGIALLGRTRSTLEETSSSIAAVSPRTKVFITTADITNKQQVDSAFSSITAHFSAVPDVLVNNAGAMVGRGHTADVDIDDYWKAFEMNVKGPLTVTMAFLRADRAAAADHGKGQNTTPATSATTSTSRTLINIASGGAVIPYAPTGSGYSCAKLANAKATEYVHYENPTWRVFNLQPGVVQTEVARQAGRKAPDSPRLSAGTAVWLAASPRAGELNGKFVWANWDVEELLARKDEIQKTDLLTLGLRGWAEVSAEEMIRISKGVHRDAER